MSPTAMLSMWVGAAVVLMFFLIIAGTGWRIHQNRLWKQNRRTHQALRPLERRLRWPRAGIVVGALAPAIWLGTASDSHYALAAPSLWAGLTIAGLTGLDWLVLGRPAQDGRVARTTPVHRLLPWKLLALTGLGVFLLARALDWAWRHAHQPDHASYFDSWMIDGVLGYGIRAPFPGAHYSVHLIQTLPVVPLLAGAGIALILWRGVYRPHTWLARFDRSLRQSAIRDLVLTALGALTACLAIVTLQIAWAVGTIGSPDPGSAVVAGAGLFVGASSLAIGFWVFANLVFLPVPVEDRSTVVGPVVEVASATATAETEVVGGVGAAGEIETTAGSDEASAAETPKTTETTETDPETEVMGDVDTVSEIEITAGSDEASPAETTGTTETTETDPETEVVSDADTVSEIEITAGSDEASAAETPETTGTTGTTGTTETTETTVTTKTDAEMGTTQVESLTEGGMIAGDDAHAEAEADADEVAGAGAEAGATGGVAGATGGEAGATGGEAGASASATGGEADAGAETGATDETELPSTDTTHPTVSDTVGDTTPAMAPETDPSRPTLTSETSSTDQVSGADPSHSVIELPQLITAGTAAVITDEPSPVTPPPLLSDPDNTPTADDSNPTSPLIDKSTPTPGAKPPKPSAPPSNARPSTPKKTTRPRKAPSATDARTTQGQTRATQGQTRTPQGQTTPTSQGQNTARKTQTTGTSRKSRTTARPATTEVSEIEPRSPTGRRRGAGGWVGEACPGGGGRRSIGRVPIIHRLARPGLSPRQRPSRLAGLVPRARSGAGSRSPSHAPGAPRRPSASQATPR